MRKAKGRALAFVLAFCMVFTGMFTQNTAKVKAEGNDNSILTSYNIMLNNQELTDSTVIKNGDKFVLSFEWALANGNTKDEYVLDLEMKGIVITTDGEQNVTKSSGEVVGTYWIDSDGKVHIKFDTSKAFFGENERKGGISLDGIVNISEDDAEDHSTVEIGWVESPYKAIFSYGNQESWLQVGKSLSGNVTADANGKYWQEFKIDITAYNNDVKSIVLTDTYQSGLSNMQNITVTGAINATPASWADLNTLLQNGLAKDQKITITYKMQVDDSIYDQNAVSGNFNNKIDASYVTNENSTENSSSNITVNVNKPSINKTGSISDGKVTWTITATLGDFEDDGDTFAAIVDSMTDTLGAGLDTSDIPQDLEGAFQENPAGSGVYVATYTTDITYANLVTAENTIKMNIDKHDYIATATVTNNVQWISKSLREVQGDYLVWDVYLSPKVNITNVSLNDITGNSHTLGDSIYVDDVAVITINQNRLDQSGTGVFTDAAESIVTNSKNSWDNNNATLYNNMILNFKDSYIAEKVTNDKPIKITYKTLITDTTAKTIVNTATVNYTDPVLNKTEQQSAQATYTVPEEIKNKMSIEKYGWGENYNERVYYYININFGEYLELSNDKLKDYKFTVVDTLPAGLELSDYIDEWTPVITVYAGDQDNQSVAVDWTKDTKTVTVDGEQRQQITFNLTLTEAALNELRRVDSETTKNPTIRIVFRATVTDMGALVREGAHTYVNDVESTFDQIDMDAHHTLNLSAPSVISKTGNYDTATGINKYTIKINERGYDLSEAGDVLTGVDTLGAWDNYIYDTVKVVKVENGAQTELKKGVDYKYTYSTENHTLTFEGLPDETYLIVTYDARVQLIDGDIAPEDIENKFELYGFESSPTKSSVKTVSTVSKANLRGWASSEYGEITIQKFWTNDGQMVALPGATFDLYYAEYDTATGEMKLVGDPIRSNIEINADNGTVTIARLPMKSIYALVETKAPYGYVVGEPYYFVLRDDFYVDGSVENPVIDTEFKALIDSIPSSIGLHEFINGVTVLYENEPATGNLEIRKTLSGITLTDAQEENITFTINPAPVGTQTTYKLSEFTKAADGTYSKVFQKVPVGEYTIVENRTAIDGYSFTGMTYTVSVAGTQLSSGTENATTTGTEMKAMVEKEKTTNVAVTNTYSTIKTSVTVKKDWSDGNNQDGLRTALVQVQLKANSSNLGTPITLNSANNWTYTWDELEWKKDGAIIAYTVEEINVPAGYTSTVTGDAQKGYTITNSHTPATIAISGSKTWKDNDNQDGNRPTSITVHLLADGVEKKYQNVSASNGWKWNFGNMPKYANGQEIKYTITETIAAGYTPVIDNDNFNITNSYTPGKTSVTVTKSWNDSNNQDGKRPTSVTVQLLADGTVMPDKTVTLGAANNWTYTWTGLDQKKAGADIQYTVKEVDVKDYTSVISGDAKKGYTITNSYTPEKITVSGFKTWSDSNDQDGKRPDSITVNLLANGKQIDSKTVTASDGWKWTFDNLPKYENGTSVTYSITETAIDDYTTTVSGYNITNSYTPGKTSVTVTKSWEDNNNQDGIRPSSIQVQLLADGKAYGSLVILNEANKWSYTWTGLDQKKDGTDIAYMVQELTVTGYNSVILGNAKDGFKIINTHTPEKVTVSGTKTWDDANNQDGKRPDSITVNLLANGTKIDSKTVTASDGWKWTFSDLDKFANGQPITYTITETDVVDYLPTIEGYNIINKYTPGKTSVTVNKSWSDGNNQDGIRPESVQVQLYADDVKLGQAVTLDDSNQWNYTWDNLDQKKAGKDIVYTVKEVTVPAGYTASITGNARIGYTIINSHTPETVIVKGSKTWTDNNNQDGKRPESMTVHLLADGVEKHQKVVTVQDNWSWTFDGLPKYENGKEIVYTITESGITDYNPVITGYDIENKYTPGKTFITVNKVWSDNNNQDGKRPESVQVQLYADGVATGQAVTLNADNSWLYTWTGLEQMKDGKEIQYTVDEVTVPVGYTKDISGTAQDGYTIINSYETENVTVSGSKTWSDDNDKAGKRPESITIRLLADGKEVDSKVVTETDNWSWEFANLAKYTNGAEIKYTITEDAVTGYTTVVKGYNVTNTYKVEEEPTPGPDDVTPTPGPDDATPTPGPDDVTPTPGPDDATPTPGPDDVTSTPKPNSPTPTPKPGTGGSGSANSGSNTSPDVLDSGKTPAPSSVPTVEIEVTIPKTADEAPVAAWLAFILIGLGGMITVGVLVLKRRNNKEN